MVASQSFNRRRLDRVLDPNRSGDLPGMDDETLRALRKDADQEEAEQSYVRRLLQGRLDLVSDEQRRRAAHAENKAGVRSDEELAQMLSAILTGPVGQPRTGAAGGRVGGRYIDAEAEHGGMRRRAAEVAANDLRLSDPTQLDDAELARARARLESLEHEVSSLRRDLQTVADAVAAEVTRRLEL